MPTELHIGIDSEKAVVSPYRIRLRSGRARRRRTGTVTEMLPLPPSGRSREIRVTFTARVAFPLLFVSAALFGAGLPWWLPAAACAALISAVWRRQARAAQPASFEPPAGDGVRVLWSSPERAAFEQAVQAARRVRDSLPGMIDEAAADRSLARALEDLAGVLARRQEIRRVRAALLDVRPEDVPADSPALRSLAEQREHADRLFAEASEQATRIVHSIDATARAGETFHHEQRIGATARRAEAVLAGLTVGVVPAETAPDLAARTDAVISAYRDLAATDQS